MRDSGRVSVKKKGLQPNRKRISWITGIQLVNIAMFLLKLLSVPLIGSIMCKSMKRLKKKFYLHFMEKSICYCVVHMDLRINVDLWYSEIMMLNKAILF